MKLLFQEHQQHTSVNVHVTVVVPKVLIGKVTSEIHEIKLKSFQRKFNHFIGINIQFTMRRHPT